jgi:LuxR family transcriptional activator of bioluminescence operon
MKLNEFEHALKEAKTEQMLQQALEAYFKAFGFTALAFTLYLEHPKTGNPLQYDCVSSSLKNWHQHYLNEKYADVDNTLAALNHSVLPIAWDIHEQIEQAKNIREKRMRIESKEFGINKGLLIPIHGPDKDFACLCLHQLIGENGLENLKLNQFDWMIVSLLYYHYLKMILLKTKTKKNGILSKREIQCLQLTKENFSVSDIAKKLNITAATVNFHLQNANKKLGVKNKYQAILKWQDEL